MTSLAIADRTINVTFYGNSLFVVEHNGEAYTPMRPIIDGMGMDWASQFTKLKQRFKSTVVEITMVAADGKSRSMICLALRKLAAWLQTISPNKVRPEIRDNVIRYQEECDDVLYEYWTKGEVKNPRKPETTVDDRTPLRGIVNRIMGKYGMTYQAVYKLVHKEFGVRHIDELSPKQTSEAIEYLATKAIEGEFIGKQKEMALRDYNFPAETADPHDRKFGNAWMTPRVILDEKNRAPELELLEALERDGYDVTGARIRIHAMYGVSKQLIEMQRELCEAMKYVSTVKDIIKNLNVERGTNVSFTGDGIGMAYGGYPKRSLSR
ncbi:phage antirepressor N-terminal domain-containing protein [Serratia sp. IR-2025]